jgi:protein-S-isoprenylcysteine O-methyltransferase Ste14
MNDYGTVLRRAIRSLAAFSLLLAAALFVPAGIGWRLGWLFLAVFLLQIAIAAVYLWRVNPEIYVARSRFHKGTKAWDKLVLCLLFPAILAVFPVAGLDHRYDWSSVPGWLVGAGYALLTVGMLGSVWVEAVNKFAEPGVRIQTERGHKVVDTGPYAIVRHPMYATSLLLFGGVALCLGSYWALIPVATAGIVVVVRTALEDRTLQRELAGYKEYAGRVRYRLIPGVW